jgi:hypothetical protein
VENLVLHLQAGVLRGSEGWGQRRPISAHYLPLFLPLLGGFGGRRLGLPQSPSIARSCLLRPLSGLWASTEFARPKPPNRACTSSI